MYFFLHNLQTELVCPLRKIFPWLPNQRYLLRHYIPLSCFIVFKGLNNISRFFILLSISTMVYTLFQGSPLHCYIYFTWKSSWQMVTVWPPDNKGLWMPDFFTCTKGIYRNCSSCGRVRVQNCVSEKLHSLVTTCSLDWKAEILAQRVQ